MNKEFEVKIAVSEIWQNPYKNGHYTQIDISILNNTSSVIKIQSIDIVCKSKNIKINKDIIKCDFIKPHSICNYENNSDIYRILECHKCISENFYLLIEHSLGKTISNTLNISVPPIYDFPK